jgi:hypothetical protein
MTRARAPGVSRADATAAAEEAMAALEKAGFTLEGAHLMVYPPGGYRPD